MGELPADILHLDLAIAVLEEKLRSPEMQQRDSQPREEHESAIYGLCALRKRLAEQFLKG